MTKCFLVFAVVLLASAASAENRESVPALFAASSAGDVEKVKALLDAGANIEATNSSGSTALMAAAFKGHTEVVAMLLKRGAKVNAQNDQWLDPLAFASDAGHSDIVRLLLIHGGSDRNDAIALAARHKHADIVKMLLTWDRTYFMENGAFIGNYAYYIRPDHMQVAGNELFMAAGRGDLKTVETLTDTASFNDPKVLKIAEIIARQQGRLDVQAYLENKAKQTQGPRDDRSSFNLKTRLEVMFRKGELNKVMAMIHDSPDVTANDAIVLACQYADVTFVRTLVRRGATLDPVSTLSAEALCAAGRAGKSDIVEFLLASGINVNVTMKYDWTALMSAASDGRVEAITVLLDHKADVNRCTVSGRTALMSAAERGHLEAVRLLIGGKANVHLRNDQGKTALDMAQAKRYTQIVGELTKAGAVAVSKAPSVNPLFAAVYKPEEVTRLIKAGVDINEAGSYGQTPLEQAIESQCFESAKILVTNGAKLEGSFQKALLPVAASCRAPVDLVTLMIEKGAAVDERSFQDKTALMFAAGAGNRALVKCLIEHGADVNLRDRNNLTALDYARLNDQGHIVELLSGAKSVTSGHSK